MAHKTSFLAALAAGLLLAVAAGAQEPSGTPQVAPPAPSAIPAKMPPADQPAEALPPPPAEPQMALPAPSTVPAEVLVRLARAADDVWRVAVLAPSSERFGDRVALTQADLSRRLERLARSQGIDLPPGPSTEGRQRADALRAQPPEGIAGSLAALVRQTYPDMVGTLEGWRDGPEQAVATALLPPLRAELEQAERLENPALTGSSGSTGGTASPQ